MKNYIGISRDHSISMRGIATAAQADYNRTIAAIREAAIKEQIDTIVNVVKCGGDDRARVLFDVNNSSVHALSQLTSYICPGSSTPLLDSVGALIERLEASPDAADPNTTFLVMTITDGEENSSTKWTYRSISKKIADLQSTGRWTFVFRVPRGARRTTCETFGVSSENVLEWETTTRGMEESTAVTATALSSYYTQVRSGVKRTDKFYTNLSDVTSKDVQKQLTDISQSVKLWVTSQKEVIREYCERMTGQPFIKGAAFYQLTKPEPEVQDYKMIAIRDKATGKVYAGAAARSMLNLPATGTAYVKPGDHGQFDIYIQSTSINRVLPPGTQVLYWSTPGVYPTATTAPATTAKQVTLTPVTKAAVVAPVQKSNLTQALHTPDWIAGYKVGFVDGKNKTSSPRARSIDWSAGYDKGHKDGRGKQKRLYK